MTDFEVHFTRYSKKRAERENSAAMFIRADDFNKANDAAQLACRAMRDVPTTDEWEYEVQSIHAQGYGGKTYSGYVSIWSDPPSTNKP